jgi:hypothetical protein
MSPEQARGEKLDTRTDLFSFGAVLYEMATGRPAFDGATSAVIFHRILAEAPEPPLRLNPSLPAKLEEIINKTLEKDRDLRCQHASEMRTDLKRLKRDTDSGRGTGVSAVGEPARPSVDIHHTQDARATAGETPLRPPPPSRALTRLTFDLGLQFGVTWSPDGCYFAYSSDRGGKFDIWVQQVGGTNPVRVSTRHGHNWQPDWSPDGKQIVFRSEGDGGGLFVVPALGGYEHKIASFGYRPRWSPDGSQVLFSSTFIGWLWNKLYVVALNGETPREVLTKFFEEHPMTERSVAWHPEAKGISVWCWASSGQSDKSDGIQTQNGPRYGNSSRSVVWVSGQYRSAAVRL